MRSGSTPSAYTGKARVLIRDWGHECPGTALAAKSMIINPTRRSNEIAAKHINKSWGPVYANLFKEFSKWMRDIHMEKARLVDGYEEKISEILSNQPNEPAKESDLQQSDAQEPETQQPEATPDPEELHQSVFAELYSKAESHYEAVVNMIHEAICSLEAVPEDPRPPPSVSISQNRKKGGPTLKRQRTSSSSSDSDEDVEEANKAIKLFHPRSRHVSMAGGSSRPQVPCSTAASVPMDTSA